MEYHVLASGSKGNSTFVVEKSTGILIDCGISRKQLNYRLKEIGYTPEDIDYVLLTHDHYDHSKNIHTFDKKIIYTAKGNLPDLDEDHELEPYESYQFGDINVFVLRISHDATNPVAFILKGEESLLYMTDTGYVSQKNKELIHDLNYYIIEANHDIGMLMPYLEWTLLTPFTNIGILGLTILLLFSKSVQYKSLGKLAIATSIFNITEPVMFGFPIIGSKNNRQNRKTMKNGKCLDMCVTAL